MLGACRICGDLLEQETYFGIAMPDLCRDCVQPLAEREREEQATYVRSVVDQSRAARTRNRMATSGMRAEFVDATEDKLLPHPSGEHRASELAVIARLKAWIERTAEKPSVYIHGNPGTGKSYLSQAALRECILRGDEGRFAKFGELLATLRKAMFADSATEHDRDVMERWMNMPRLVLDDLGATEKPSDFTLRTAFEIIDHRLHRKLPTIITANFSLRRLAERLTPEGSDGTEAERIVDRIKEMAEVVELKGESYR